MQEEYVIVFYKLYTTDKRYEDKRITLKLNFTLFALSKKKNEQNHYFFHTVLRLNQILYRS